MIQEQNKISNWSQCFKQHLVIGISSYLLYLLFYYSKSGLPHIHQINRSWADTSVVLLFITLMIGPIVRISPKFKYLIPWRRDFGLWFALTAVLHIGLLAHINLHWHLFRFFMDEQGVLLKGAAHASNWAGLIALMETIVLAITSNRISEKFLGKSAWKYIQQTTYTVFWLVVLHTFIFVYLLDKRNAFLFLCFFWAGIFSVICLQIWGFLITIKMNRRNNRS